MFLLKFLLKIFWDLLEILETRHVLRNNGDNVKSINRAIYLKSLNVLSINCSTRLWL